MTRGEAVAAEAREWIGTPFLWQQSVKSRGCDCKGLVWGVARELGFPEAESLYAQVADYSPERPVPSALLQEGLAEIFDEVTDIQPGDVLLLRCRPGAAPSHLAIATFDDRAVHAQIGPKDWVKETKLRALLKACPLVSIWRWRDGR